MVQKRTFDKPTVFFGRHGETAWNTGDPETDRAKGIENDLPLTRKGHEEAISNGKKLAPYAIAEIHASKMLRSKQSVAHVAEATGAKVIEDAALDPWDVGYLAGQLRKEIADRVDYYISHPRREVPEGEPYGEYWKRITEAFARILKKAEGLEHEDGGYCAIDVNGHSDGTEAVTSWLDGSLPEAHTAQHSIKPGAILIFEKVGRSWKWDEWSGGASSERDEE